MFTAALAGSEPEPLIETAGGNRRDSNSNLVMKKLVGGDGKDS